MSTKGALPIKEKDIPNMLNELSKGRLGLRNRCMFLLEIGTGFRIKELLSLKISDVVNINEKPYKVNDEVKVDKSNMKGKKGGRSVPIPDNCIEELSKYILAWPELFHESITKQSPLFPSQIRNSGEIKGVLPMTTRNADILYVKCGQRAGLTYKVTTHSCRKTLAKRVKDVTKDIMAVKTALGHSNISSTMSYIPEDIDTVKELMRKLK